MKGETTAKSMIIIGIVITMVIAGTLGLVGSLATNYSKSPDLQSINRSVELGDKIEETYELFQDENVETDFLGSNLITGANIIWNFITLILEVPGALGDMVNDLGRVAGVPTIYLAGASLIILTIGLFAVFKIITNT